MLTVGRSFGRGVAQPGHQKKPTACGKFLAVAFNAVGFFDRLQRKSTLQREKTVSFWDDAEEGMTFKVVLNHEEQYSIWPADRANPLGWRDAGKQGSKIECLAYIEEVWTDMRPLSLRKKMEEQARLGTGDVRQGAERA